MLLKLVVSFAAKYSKKLLIRAFDRHLNTNYLVNIVDSVFFEFFIAAAIDLSSKVDLSRPAEVACWILSILVFLLLMVQLAALVYYSHKYRKNKMNNKEHDQSLQAKANIRESSETRGDSKTRKWYVRVLDWIDRQYIPYLVEDIRYVSPVAI